MPEPDEWHRAGGDCICEVCGKEYRRHPHATEPEYLGWPDNTPFLHRLCNGDLVKL